MMARFLLLSAPMVDDDSHTVPTIEHPVEMLREECRTIGRLLSAGAEADTLTLLTRVAARLAQAAAEAPGELIEIQIARSDIASMKSHLAAARHGREAIRPALQSALLQAFDALDWLGRLTP
ncbi:MAG TPA: hypothetical protein VFB58_10770 [Chloroflexota bacterium]|nr:hypothetical protein [Chloroflexota bacterium]